MPKPKKQAKPRAIGVCAQCGGTVTRSDGGTCTIPISISGLPAHDETLHNHCLHKRIEALEKARRPLPTHFSERDFHAVGLDSPKN